MNKPLDSDKTPPHFGELKQPVIYYMPSQAESSADEEQISLLEIFQIIRRNIILMSIIILSAGVAALFFALTAKTYYRAEVLLKPNSYDEAKGKSPLMGQFGDLAAIAGVNLSSSGGNVEYSLAVLKSRYFTGEFIQSEKLLPGLVDMDAAKTAEQMQWEGFKTFDRLRSVNFDKKTGLVKLSFEWTEAKTAADVVNNLVTKVNENIRNRVIQDADKNIAYLNEELIKTSVGGLQQAIYRLVESEIKSKMLASVQVDYAFQIIDPAVVPQEKSKPNRKMILFMGIFIGIVLAFLVIFLRHFIAKLRE